MKSVALSTEDTLDSTGKRARKLGRCYPAVASMLSVTTGKQIEGRSDVSGPVFFFLTSPVVSHVNSPRKTSKRLPVAVSSAKRPLLFCPWCKE